MKYIYTITDPRDNKVFYVGVSVDVEARAKSHMNLTLYASCRSRIEEIVLSGLRPVFTIVHDKCENWREVEQDFIKKYLDEGLLLLNKQSHHIKRDYGFDLVTNIQGLVSDDLKKANLLPKTKEVKNV